MHISTLQIKNFKKLKDVIVPLNNQQSIFVGANNSGKTSAFEAISKFLNRNQDENKRRFSIYDFTIYNWARINELFDELLYLEWSEEEMDKTQEKYKQKQKELEELFPSLKVVIDVKQEELHRVIHLIPRLDSDIKQVAVYQIYEPKDYGIVLQDYNNARKAADKKKEVLLEKYEDEKEKAKKVQDSIWPQSFRDFLEREDNLHRYFTVRYYLANPNSVEEEFIFDEVTEYTYDPLKSIIKVDEINAQRGLTDDENYSEFKGSKRISSQFSKYHKRFNGKTLDVSDFDATLEYEKYFAEQTISENLKESLGTLISPLQSLGYPAFGSPSIVVAPVIDIIKTIEEEGNILFNPHNGIDERIYLPESSNGLGFQNLIYIFLKLQYFCRSRLDVDDSLDVQPLHLILIEEPEAHLHAQAQKIFIDKALDVIQEDRPDGLYSQLLLSTHSSHVANESEFNNLLYFKRELDKNNHIANVVHLSNVHMDPRFNYKRKSAKENESDQKSRNNEENEKFVKKYLEVAEHDLFFADAIIVIEGSSERILLPEMLKKNFPNLRSKYITFFEVGGSYAHLFLPWLRALERPTLIITDIDTGNKDKNTKKIHTTTEENRVSKNPTIGEWFSREVDIQDLVTCDPDKKEQGNIRISYQYKNHGTGEKQAYSRTFEDDFALTNKHFFRSLEGATGLAKKYKDILDEYDTIDESLTKKLFDATDSTKTSFALDILFNELKQDSKIKLPVYIQEGFKWLQDQLKNENKESGDLNET